MSKAPVQLIRFLRATTGGKHGWFLAEKGGRQFEVRKPIGVTIFRPQFVLTRAGQKAGWWARFKNWIRSKWQR